MTTVTWIGQWHPFAERFPMLSEQELREMAESIKETGQLNPCVMNPDGLGLDGRNRVAACRIAGLEPEWTVNSGNPMSIIIAANVHHRFLTTGQRAMAVAVDLADKGMRLNGRWKRGSVPDAPDAIPESGNKAWINAVAQAGIVLDWLPERADEVLTGTVALDAAYTRAKDKRDIETSNAEKFSHLPPDLAALVESGVRELEDALSEAEARITVRNIDRVRDRDGAPAPSFGQRAEEGQITWTEAATLAEQWQQERGESIERDRARIHAITAGWGAVRSIADAPDSAYVVDLLATLGERDREVLDDIVKQVRR